MFDAQTEVKIVKIDVLRSLFNSDYKIITKCPTTSNDSKILNIFDSRKIFRKLNVKKD